MTPIVMTSMFNKQTITIFLCVFYFYFIKYCMSYFENCVGFLCACCITFVFVLCVCEFFLGAPLMRIGEWNNCAFANVDMLAWIFGCVRCVSGLISNITKKNRQKIRCVHWNYNVCWNDTIKANLDTRKASINKLNRLCLSAQIVVCDSRLWGFVLFRPFHSTFRWQTKKPQIESTILYIHRGIKSRDYASWWRPALVATSWSRLLIPLCTNALRKKRW